MRWTAIFALLFLQIPSGFAGLDFFQISKPKYHKQEPRDQFGVWEFRTAGRAVVERRFQPCLEVRLKPRENIFPSKVIAKAYFYDTDNQLVCTLGAPSKSGLKTGIPSTHLPLPPLLKAGESSRIFFAVPEALKDKDWKAVIVAGDRNELHSATYPAASSDLLFEFPEKRLIKAGKPGSIERKDAVDHLIERVVRTGVEEQPQITLFLRLPKGVTDPSEVRGVMAVCFVATGVDHIRKQMQMEEMTGDYGGIFSFANRHKLAVLSWGAVNLWDKTRNRSEIASSEGREADRAFDKVANAWERAAVTLLNDHDLPDRNLLLWGCSIGAQWAHRLCLRKPERFLAVHIHIPSSFDIVRPEAAGVLWCLTTGELESGYERSKQFLRECQAMNYPIIYKAYPGLGHASNRTVYQLGYAAFEYALAKLPEKSAAPLPHRSPSPSQNPGRFPEFQSPQYYADVVNQEVVPAGEADRIPEAFRIVLPNEEIAELWKKTLE